MSAPNSLMMARAAGVTVLRDGADLALTALVRPPDDLIDRLANDKAAILEYSVADHDRRTAEDWRDFFGERAALAEVDGCLSFDDAEACAFACCLAEWMRRNCADLTAVAVVQRIVEVDPIDLILGPTRSYAAGGLAQIDWDVSCERALLEAADALNGMSVEIHSRFPDDFGKNGGA
jgi:hypothetical protein